MPDRLADDMRMRLARLARRGVVLIAEGVSMTPRGQAMIFRLLGDLLRGVGVPVGALSPLDGRAKLRLSSAWIGAGAGRSLRITGEMYGYLTSLLSISPLCLTFRRFALVTQDESSWPFNSFACLASASRSKRLALLTFRVAGGR